MAVRVQCPNPECGRSYSVRESHLGRAVVCKTCGRRFTLSGSGQETKRPAAESDTGQALVPPSLGAVPQKLGRFKIRSRLGAGAFGAVYRAYDPVLDREVALKVPHAGTLETEEDKARFLQEAKAAGRLRHPNIVPVYDAGADGDTYFIASAFIEGQTLEDSIERDRPDFREATQIVTHLASALDYAHRLGIVHRDVKPANIMVDAAGEPLLMDFGLARFEERESKLTQDGTLLGTPAYMAPEQASTRHELVGPASDQYALGVVLYELLCGETPFSGPPAMVISLVINQEPPSPRSYNAAVPKDLETICLKAMSKGSEQRYGSCLELADDLRRWQEGEAIHARRLRPVERAWRWCRRNPIVAGLSATAALLLLLVALVTSVAYVKTSRALLAAENEQQRALEAEASERRRAESEEKQRRRAEEALYLSHIRYAYQNWLASDIEQAEALLDACPQDSRHWEWGYLKRLCHLDLLSLSVDSGPIHAMSFDANGTRIFAVDGYNQLVAWDATTGELVESLTTHRGRVVSAAFCPAVMQVASVSSQARGEIKIWDGLTGEETTVFGEDTRFRHDSNLAFSPDGKRVALASGAISSRLEAEFTVWDVDSGQQVLNLRPYGDSPWSSDVRALAFGPKGGVVAAASTMRFSGGIGPHGRTGEVKVWDARNGREILRIREVGHTDKVHSVAFHPNGKWIASASPRETKLWDAVAGRELLTLKGISSYVAFSPDGKSIAGSAGTYVELLDATSGRRVRTFRGNRSGPVRVAFSPDGKRLATGGRMVKIWDLASGEEIASLQGERSVRGLTFSPDGTRIAAKCDRNVQVWDAGTGDEVLSLETEEVSGGLGIATLAFSPDGKRIAFAGKAQLTVWDVASRAKVLTLEDGSDCVAFSPNGERLASGSRDNAIQVWDAQGRKLLTLRGHTADVECLAFSPDGAQIGSGSEDRSVIVWDLASGKAVAKFASCGRHFEKMSSVAISPDGTRVATGGAGEMRLWDIKTGREISTLSPAGRPLPDRCEGTVFSPDGTRVAAITESRTVTVWNLPSGEEQRSFVLGSARGPKARSLTFSPDGSKLACGWGDEGRETGGVRVWDETGVESPILQGHDGQFECLAFSPDGGRIASGGDDRDVRVWDVASGEELIRFDRHDAPITSVAFDPDGKRIVSASSEGTVTLWDSGKGDPLLTLRGVPARGGQPYQAQFTPDGRQIALANPDGSIRLFDASSGEERRTLKRHAGRVVDLALSPDGTLIVSASDGEAPVSMMPPSGRVTAWKLPGGEELLAIDKNNVEFTGVAFSRDGKRMATGSARGVVTVWDAATGDELLNCWGHTRAVQSLEFAPDGTRILSASLDNSLRLWDADTGQELLVVRGHSGGVKHVAFSPDGQLIASGGGRTIKLWHTGSRPSISTLKGHTDRICSIAFSPDGRRIASGSDDRTVKIWEVETGRELFTYRGHVGNEVGVAFHPEGNRIASASHAGMVRVWDPASGHELVTFPEPSGPGRIFSAYGGTVGRSSVPVTYSPDGTRIAAAVKQPAMGTRPIRDPHLLKIWDARSGEESLALKNPDDSFMGTATSIAFAPGGARIAAAAITADPMPRRDSILGRLVVWDAISGEPLLTVDSQQSGIRSVAFAPDGARIAAGYSNGTLTVYDAASGEELFTVRHRDAVSCVAFSPDGKRIVSGSVDKTVRLWDASSGYELITLDEAGDAVRTVVFTPDGKTLAAGTRDGRILLWESWNDGEPQPPSSPGP